MHGKWTRLIVRMIPCLLISMIPLALAVVCSMRAQYTVDEEMHERANTEMAYCASRLEAQLDGVTQTVNTLCEIAARSELCRVESPYVTTPTLIRGMEFQEQMAKYLYASYHYRDAYCYFAHSGMVTGCKESFISADQFASSISYAGHDASEWINGGKSGILSAGRRMAFQEDKGVQMLYYARFPLLSGRGGVAMVFFSPDILTPYMADVAQSGGAIALLDGDGAEIYRYPEGENVLSGEMTVRARIASNGWTLKCIVPSAMAEEASRAFKRVQNYLYMASLLICMVSALVVAYQTFKPVKDISRAAYSAMGRDWNGELVNAQDISDSLAGLIRQKALMKQRLDEQMHLVQENVMYRMLRGLRVEDVDRNMPILQSFLDGVGGKMVVLLFIPDGRDGIAPAARMGGKDLVEKRLREAVDAVFFCDVSLEARVFLLGSSLDEEALNKAADAAIADALDALNRDGMTPRFAVSDVFFDLDGMSARYEETTEIAQYQSVLAGRPVMRYSDLCMGSGEYYYPLEAETRLIVHIKAGNFDMLSALLDRIWDENVQRRTLSPYNTRALLDDVRCTLMKVLHSVELRDSEYMEGLAAKIARAGGGGFAETLEEYFSLMKSICNIVRMEERESGASRAMEAVVKYIDENYADADMGLKQLADRFRLSVPYLSKAFKETTGITFSNYLERLRVNRACLLLTEGAPVEKAARDVGYNSVGTFRNSFKRCLGVSPTEYARAAIAENAAAKG